MTFINTYVYMYMYIYIYMYILLNMCIYILLLCIYILLLLLYIYIIIMYIYIYVYIYIIYYYILLYIYYNFTGSLAGTYLGTFLHRTLLCKLPFGRVSLTLSRGFFRIAKLFYETYFVDTKIKYFKRKLSSEEVLPLGPASTLEILVSGDGLCASNVS